jgi:hypothetical protein
MPQHDLICPGPAACRSKTSPARQPRPPHLPTVVLVVMAALLSLTACASRPHPYIEELKALPDATLLYPDSHLDTALGHDSDNKMGGNSAIYGNRALTNATAPEVLKYYDTQLRAKGWTRDDSKARRNGYWEISYAWTRGEQIFQLGFYGKYGIAQMVELNAKYANYRTIYETHLE